MYWTNATDDETFDVFIYLECIHSCLPCLCGTYESVEMNGFYFPVGLACSLGCGQLLNKLLEKCT